jgi:hypothetical protein
MGQLGLLRLDLPLSKIGHHGMDSITQQGNGTVDPRLEHGRRSVVKVTLLNLILLRDLENGMNLGRPSLKHSLQVWSSSVGHGCRPSRFGRTSQEGIPLIVAIANVGNHEILPNNWVSIIRLQSLVQVIRFDRLPDQVQCKPCILLHRCQESRT